MQLTTKSAAAVVDKGRRPNGGSDMRIEILRQTHIGANVVYVGEVHEVAESVGRTLIAYGKARAAQDAPPAADKSAGEELAEAAEAMETAAKEMSEAAEAVKKQKAEVKKPKAEVKK